MGNYRLVFAAAMLHVFSGGVQAGFVSSLGVSSNLLEPAGWNTGDAGSTHQVWDSKSTNTGNVPDQGYNVAGATLDDPTHSVESPGFKTGTNNYYSFTGDFSATADIYNHGTSGSGLGTHVIVQVGASLNPDEESFPGHGTGVFLDSLVLVDLSDSPLTGGENSEALQIAEVSYAESVPSSFGDVSYQELIFEFWLPGHTGDYRVDWDQKVHATIDTLRVDSMIAGESVGGGTPFSLTFLDGEPLPGDYDGNKTVDQLDYALWRSQYGTAGPAADGNADGIVDAADYALWRVNLAVPSSPLGRSLSVPEPSGMLLVSLFGVTLGFCGWVEWFIRPRRKNED